MKTLTFIALVLIAALMNPVNAQQNVKEKNLLGTWKMIIDIEEALEEAEREADAEDRFIEEVTLSWVSGLVDNIMEEIDIYMEFRPQGEVKVIVEAFDEREIEYSEWSIDSNGRLFIDETDSFSSDDDGYWLFEGDVLMLYEEESGTFVRSENIYLVRID